MPTTTAADDRKPIPALPPLNWRHEVPKYRISRDTKPAPKERFRFEPPFSSGSESDVWQYGERVHKAGEVIETTEWPNPGTMKLFGPAGARLFHFAPEKPVAARTVGRWPDSAERRFERCRPDLRPDRSTAGEIDRSATRALLKRQRVRDE
jgi:hypothetical protein